MGHPNRSQVRVPRRLWEEMMLALEQATHRLEQNDASIEARQVISFGQRLLSEARRRERNAEE